jgi:hypothetical protein
MNLPLPSGLLDTDELELTSSRAETTDPALERKVLH